MELDRNRYATFVGHPSNEIRGSPVFVASTFHSIDLGMFHHVFGITDTELSFSSTDFFLFNQSWAEHVSDGMTLLNY